MKIYKIIIILLSFLLSHELHAAGLEGLVAFASDQLCGGTFKSCAPGGINTHQYYCACAVHDAEANTLGYGAGQKFVRGSGGSMAWGSAAFNDLYVPAAGQYRGRMHFCTAGWGTPCKIANASFYYDTSETLAINTGSTIGSQNPHYTGVVGATLSSRAMVCITLVDQYGIEWGSNRGTGCSDANPLPQQPATCYLNGNQDLSVSMGILERSKIATTPSRDASTIITKVIPMYCTRESGVTASTTFQFAPLVVSGDEVISTSLNHLGVAMFYNGVLVGPSSEAINDSFSYGLTNIELSFQAVRDPDVAIKDIPTGDFTASVIMIVTEQ